MLDAMVSQLGNGIVLGAVIALTAVGLSLIFGVTGIVNFAHGDLVTLGATIALVLSLPADKVPGGQDMSMWIAVPLTILIGFAVGALLELTLVRPLRRRRVGTVTMLVVTIGLGFILRYSILNLLGVGLFLIKTRLGTANLPRFQRSRDSSLCRNHPMRLQTRGHLPLHSPRRSQDQPRPPFRDRMRRDHP